MPRISGGGTYGRRIGLFLTVGVVAAAWNAPASATSFGFSDEYFENNLASFQHTFGSTATGYGTSGIYQETNTSTPIATKVGSGTSVVGEYIQNTTPNANK